jgi:membrane protein implicated in regulation of membrane protease activity
MVEPFGLSLSLFLVLLGTGLCIFEAFAPGAHFIVIGGALLVAGLVGIFFPSTATPLALALLVFVVGIGSLLAYRYLDLYQGSGEGQTLDAGDLRGMRGYATEEVTTRSGSVELQNAGFASSYGARTTSGTIEEGENVVVVDPGGGNIVTVEAVEDQNDNEQNDSDQNGNEQ